jgi:hypothetical protein
MSVPPAKRGQSSTPPGKGRPDETKHTGKEFKLPPKKQQVEGKEEEAKKKGLFDLAAEEMIMQDKQQSLSQELKAESTKVEEVTATRAVAQVNQIGQLVQQMVETMRVGQIDGQDFASLDLKQSPQVPEAFAGSNLTISYQENGIVIKFDNFMTPQQQNTAITLVEKNKEQLQGMIQALAQKNIQVTEFSIGTHVVALPRVTPTPPPFQPEAALRAETEQQRREREGGEEGGGGEGGGPR